MKVILVAVVALMALAAVQADCGCLKCGKNLYVASPPNSPVQVIYRGATCSCNRQIPYTIEQPIIQAPKPVTLRHSTYRCMPMKIVKQAPTQLYSYDSVVEVPVQEKKCCPRYLVGLVAQPDRVVLPAPTCREPAPSAPSRGPVFEALTNVEDDDYLYQYPTKKCGCGRYEQFSKTPQTVPKIGPRCNDGYRELTDEEVEDNIDRNIKDIYFDDTLNGRIRRWFYFGLSDLQKSAEDEEEEPLCCCVGNFSVGSRSKRSARTKRALLPFLAPQRHASSHYPSEGQASDGSGQVATCNKRSFDQFEDQTTGHCQKKSPQQSDDYPVSRKIRSLDIFEEDNEIPHGHDEDFEEAFEELPDEYEEDTLKASNLLLDTLHVDQLLPQIPLLLFVNAPISMLAHFHKLNKHFEPVVQSVPTVIRTSGKYFSDFSNRFKKTFYVFTNCLMSGFENFGRRFRRSINSLSAFQVVKCNINPDGTVNFVLFNNSTKPKLKDIALVIENFTMDAKAAEDTRMYLAKVDTTSLRHRKKRDIFEMDVNGDLQELLKETWGHLLEDSASQNHQDLQSAEAIFENHFNQIPRLYDALKQSKVTELRDLPKTSSKSKTRFDPILGATQFPLIGEKKKHEDFGDLHPEKNLDIIKGEISTVLDRLQTYLHADIDKDLKFYEDLVKLQYLKNTLVVDWRKHLIGDQGHVVSAKMNILNYIKELEKLRAALTKKVLNLLMNQPEAGAYNRAELIRFLVELYKLQMIFTRIHEDLNDKIQLGSRFNHQNEDIFIRQLEKVHFLEKTNKFELEQHLKELRDSQVENNMKFLEKLRKLSELDESLEMEHDEREEVHQVARMIQENSHYKLKEIQQVKEINNKVALKQTYRKELKNLWDLERHILNNDDFLMSTSLKKKDSSDEKIEEVLSKEEDEDSLEKFDVLKLATPITLKPLGFKDFKEIAKELKPSLNWDKDMKNKMDDFVKDMEDKRKAWLRKTKKMADIMKEP